MQSRLDSIEKILVNLQREALGIRVDLPVDRKDSHDSLRYLEQYLSSALSHAGMAKRAIERETPRELPAPDDDEIDDNPF